MGKRNIKTKFITCAILIIFIVSCDLNQIKEIYLPKPQEKNVENKTTYALGRMIGKGLKKFSLTPEEIHIIHQGIYDEVTGNRAGFNYQEYEAKINELLLFKRSQIIGERIKQGNVMLEKLLKDGFNKLDDGVYIKFHKKGVQKSPLAYMKLNADATRFDGKTFSYFKNATVYMEALPEGLQLAINEIGENGDAKVFITYEKAFGYTGSGDIEGGEAILFDVTTDKFSDKR